MSCPILAVEEIYFLANNDLNLLQIEDEEQTLVTNVELRVLKSFVNFWFNTAY